MANAIIAYRNRADSATLTGGSWTAGMPLSNLQDRLLSRLARSTNDDPASTTFTLTLDRFRTVSVVALCRHNMSSQATWRIRAFADSGLTDQLYDSGAVNVWQAMYDSSQLEWQDDNFWSGLPSAEDLAGYYWNAIHVLPEAKSARYWKLDISDASNPAGYVEIGRLFLSEAWVPTLNMSYGASLGYTSRTEVEEAWDGTEYFDVKAPYRVAQFRLENLSQQEAMFRALDMQRVASIDKEVLFVWDPDDTQHLIRRSFLGRLRELSPLEQPYYEAHQTSFVVKELL